MSLALNKSGGGLEGTRSLLSLKPWRELPREPPHIEEEIQVTASLHTKADSLCSEVAWARGPPVRLSWELWAFPEKLIWSQASMLSEHTPPLEARRAGKAGKRAQHGL